LVHVPEDVKVCLLSTFASTKAVVAIWVVLVPTLAVGAVGVPVSAGDARDAGTAPLIVAVFPPAASKKALAFTVAGLDAVIPFVPSSVMDITSPHKM
jgi:hypothetical protein